MKPKGKFKLLHYTTTISGDHPHHARLHTMLGSLGTKLRALGMHDIGTLIPADHLRYAYDAFDEGYAEAIKLRDSAPYNGQYDARLLVTQPLEAEDVQYYPKLYGTAVEDTLKELDSLVLHCEAAKRYHPSRAARTTRLIKHMLELDCVGFWLANDGRKAMAKDIRLLANKLVGPRNTVGAAAQQIIELITHA